MSSRERFVFDTNVLIDAMCFTRSFGFRAVERAFLTGELAFSQETFAEFEQVAMRPRFDPYIAARDRRRLLASYRQTSTFVAVHVHYEACRDPTDDKFLDLAVCAGAHAIISRDADLLALHPFNGIRIEEPRTFLATTP